MPYVHSVSHNSKKTGRKHGVDVLLTAPCKLAKPCSMVPAGRVIPLQSPNPSPALSKRVVLIDLCSEIDTTLQVAPSANRCQLRSYYNVARLNDARPTYSTWTALDRYYSCVRLRVQPRCLVSAGCPSLSVDDLLSTPNNSGPSQGLPSQVDAFDWLDAKMEAVRKAQVSPKHVSLYSRLPPSSMGTTKSATVCGVPLLRPPPSRDKRLFPSDVQVTGVDLLQQLPPPPTLPAPLAQVGSGS
ncbi:hypothetical protein HPB52_008051 [Rhipicephalus sanguineus]|uniref:Uncharacterized protein n=1 Tax=Rhipicephalus sanguineus TaxID=34632 RepID=A0A9D4PM00_RHISA|nr:hypothetical protein HPB52_008051 [Rhipicephalus sanguineus]